MAVANKKTLFATGAASRIVSAALVEAAKKLWPKGKKVRMILTDQPDAMRGLEKARSAILEVRPDAEVELRSINLAEVKDWGDYQDMPEVSYLILGAATGLLVDDPAIVEKVNFTAQTKLTEAILTKSLSVPGDLDCSVVFVNSAYGHNSDLPLPHPAYQQVADPKHKAEKFLRELQAMWDFRINFVVASVVARTGASLLLMKERGRDAYAEFVAELPEGREATIEEVAEAVVQALSCEEGGKTFFVPPEAKRDASTKMLDISF